jgi:sugar lactone lactonase YvrE
MPEIHTLSTGLAFGESPRWHDGRLWVADWGAKEILAVDLEGQCEVIVKVEFPTFPMCFDWLPSGELLLVSSREGRVLRMESDGTLVTYADLSSLGKNQFPWNEIVVDSRMARKALDSPRHVPHVHRSGRIQNYGTTHSA